MKKKKSKLSLSSHSETDNDITYTDWENDIGSSPEKPEKKSHHLKSESSDTDNSSPSKMTHSQETNSSSLKSPSTKSNKIAKIKEDTTLTKAELSELLQRVSEVAPQQDSLSFKKRAEKLDWDEVKLEGHTAEFCKQQWLIVIEAVRTTRTLAEMNKAAMLKNESGKLVQHLHVPKKWKPASVLYFESRRKKFAKKHPDMKNFDLRTTALKKFSTLSQKKKQKYLDMEQEEREKYKAAMKDFEDRHPDYVTNHSKCPKTTCAMSLYIEEKAAEALETSPDRSSKHLHVKFREKWNSLKPKKKIKYFKKALKAKEKYDKDMEEYCKSHPDHQPSTNVHRGFLSKAEWQILEEHQGKPKKPTMTGYLLFSREYQEEKKEELVNMKFKELQTFFSAKWRVLSEAERQSYNDRNREEKADYVRLLEEYREGVCEEEKLLLDEEIAIARDAFSQIMKNGTNKGNSPSRVNNRKKTGIEPKSEFPGEPQKPPISGFRVYVELGLQDMEFPSKTARVRYASESWNNMSTNEKRGYARQRDELQKKYEEKMEQFKEALSSDELKQYEHFRRKREQKSRRKRRKSVESKSPKEDEDEDHSSDESIIIPLHDMSANSSQPAKKKCK